MPEITIMVFEKLPSRQNVIYIQAMMLMANRALGHSVLDVYASMCNRCALDAVLMARNKNVSNFRLKVTSV